jgi:hypothetical protein
MKLSQSEIHSILNIGHIGQCFFIRCTAILWLLQVPFEELNIVQTNYYYPSTRWIVAITNNLTRKNPHPQSDGINSHSLLDSHHILCTFLIIRSEVQQRIYQPDQMQWLIFHYDSVLLFISHQPKKFYLITKATFFICADNLYNFA